MFVALFVAVRSEEEGCGDLELQGLWKGEGGRRLHPEVSYCGACMSVK